MIEPAGIISGVPSPTASKVKGPPVSVPPLASHTVEAAILVTCTELADRLKQPERSSIFSPTPSPPISPSKARWYMKHTPGGGVSKLTADGVGGKPRILPVSSVTTQAKFSPLILARVIAPSGILSGVPSFTEVKVNGPPNSSPPLALQPLALFLITCIGFERLKHPCISSALSPTATPVSSPKEASLQIKQVPAPGLSKLTADGVGGKPSIYPESSVTTQARSPLVFTEVTAPSGMLSGVPSPTSLKVKGPPKSSPPLASHPLALVLITSIGLDRLKQPWISLAFRPIPTPVSSPKDASLQTKHVPAPGVSKSTALGEGGIPRM